MRFDVISIFPEVMAPILQYGVVGRALREGRIEFCAHDLRDHATGRHRQVDDAPFGGGPGMVFMPEPVFAAVQAARAHNAGPVILTEPWGTPLTQDLARDLAAQPGLIIVCGRYEGVDDRLRQAVDAREISIGSYVLSGGELPAMVLVDAVARLVPGVVGSEASLGEDAYGEGPGGYPQFTRPARWRDQGVPEVLLSGDHGRIDTWRLEQSRLRSPT